MDTKKINLEREEFSEGPDPIDIHVGKRLQMQRNLMGKSQEEVGNFLGLTFQQIQKYERGTNRIAASRLFRVGQFLKVLPNYFYDGLPSFSEWRNAGFAESGQSPLEGMPEANNALLQGRETMELIRAYHRIADPKQRRIIYDLAKSMAKEQL